MGRKSPEDISGAIFRSGGRPPSPPKHLSPAAKVEWWQIVNDRPADYFRASNFAVLAAYCTLVVASRRLFSYFEQLELSRPDYSSTVSEVAKLSAALTGFSAKLRLNPSNEIARQSRKQDERGMPDDAEGVLFGASHRLLGGFAKEKVVPMKSRPKKKPLDAPPL
jgi:hypothetical protein